MLIRIDKALWRLPVWARKAIIAPVAVVMCAKEAIPDAWREGRYTWRDGWTYAMEHAARDAAREET